jgi:hypothetical protein
MSEQDFALIAGGEPSLLREVEEIVVESHRMLYLKEGREWSPPIAYRWMRYENPMPVQRLAEAVENLKFGEAAFDSSAVEKACSRAVEIGFSY